MAVAKGNVARFVESPVTRTALALGSGVLLLCGCQAPSTHNSAPTPMPVVHLVPNLGKVVGPAPGHKGFTLIDTCIEGKNEQVGPYERLAASYTVTQRSDGARLVSKLSIVTDRSDHVTHAYVNGSSVGPEKPAQPLTSEAGVIATGFAHWQSGAAVALPRGDFATAMAGAADVACSVYVPTNAQLMHGAPGEERMGDLPTGTFVEVDPVGGQTGQDAAHNTFFLEQYAAGGFAQAEHPTPMTLAPVAK